MVMVKQVTKNEQDVFIGRLTNFAPCLAVFTQSLYGKLNSLTLFLSVMTSDFHFIISKKSRLNFAIPGPKVSTTNLPARRMYGATSSRIWMRTWRVFEVDPIEVRNVESRIYQLNLGQHSCWER